MSTETQLPVPDDNEPTYIKPAIIHELDLETRAGSPLGGKPNPIFDPLGIDPTTDK